MAVRNMIANRIDLWTALLPFCLIGSRSNIIDEPVSQSIVADNFVRAELSRYKNFMYSYMSPDGETSDFLLGN